MKRGKHRGIDRWGFQAGSVILGFQKTPVSKPRARKRRDDGSSEEVQLETYENFSTPSTLSKSVLKRMLSGVSGRNFAQTLEKVAESSGLIKEVAVIGVPHSKLGQIVKAHTVLEPGQWSDYMHCEGEEKKEHRQKLIQLMREYCGQHLKRELRPMEWEFYSCDHPLPRTSAGKIDKKQLS